MNKKIQYVLASSLAMLVGICSVFYVEKVLYISFIILSITGVYVYLVNKHYFNFPRLSLISFFVIFLALIFNYGFVNITFPIGNIRIPFLEAFILFIVIIYIKFIKKILLKKMMIFAIATHYLVMIYHLPIDYLDYGLIAVRDALPQIDMMSLFAGFAIFVSTQRVKNEIKILPLFVAFFACLTLYFLLFPFSNEFREYSPQVYGVQQNVSILGYFATASVLVPVSIIFIIFLITNNLVQYWYGLMFLALTSINLVFHQSRASYLFIMLSVGFLFFNSYRREAVLLLILIGFSMFILFAISLMEVEVDGRVDKLGISIVIDQLESIGGSSGLESQAGGVLQRLDWWSDAIELWSDSVKNMVLGVGYGTALTNFTVLGESGVVLVREPHNSYITMLVRLGLVGFISWLFICYGIVVSIYKVVFDDIYRCSREEHIVYLTLLLFIIFSMLNALVQPVYEFPFFAVPFYFISGWFLALEMSKNKILLNN